jgi:hypothetical protein
MRASPGEAPRACTRRAAVPDASVVTFALGSFPSAVDDASSTSAFFTG